MIAVYVVRRDGNMIASKVLLPKLPAAPAALTAANYVANELTGRKSVNWFSLSMGDSISSYESDGLMSFPDGLALVIGPCFERSDHWALICGQAAPVTLLREA